MQAIIEHQALPSGCDGRSSAGDLENAPDDLLVAGVRLGDEGRITRGILVLTIIMANGRGRSIGKHREL
jgi:hypothetical protein